MWSTLQFWRKYWPVSNLFSILAGPAWLRLMAWLSQPERKTYISYRTGSSRKYQYQFSITIIVNLRCFLLTKNHAKTLLRSTNDVARHCLRWYSVFLMDSRKVKDFSLQGQKASPAYFHEQSKLRKRLDGYEREKEKCLTKNVIAFQNALQREFNCCSHCFWIG